MCAKSSKNYIGNSGNILVKIIKDAKDQILDTQSFVRTNDCDSSIYDSCRAYL